jgi:hypothetical protein
MISVCGTAVVQRLYGAIQKHAGFERPSGWARNLWTPPPQWFRLPSAASRTDKAPDKEGV